MAHGLLPGPPRARGSGILVRVSAQIILHNADVYSSVDPFATAIAFDGEQVAWVGSDEGALARSGTSEDLEGSFVAPGFVTAGVDLRTTDVTGADLVSAGIVVAHVVGSQARIDAFVSGAPEDLAIMDYPIDGHKDRAAVSAETFVAAPLAAQASQFVLVDAPAELRSVLESLSDPDVRTHAQRHMYRLLVACEVGPEDIAALANSGLAVTLDPKVGDQPLADLLGAGAQLSFVLDPHDPWSSVQAAVFGVSRGITARAAFSASTRWGYRAIGHHESGVLAPGSAADAVQWRVADLVVQSADSRVSAWSTDPRAGTPGLPDLTPGAELPDLQRVWIKGREMSSEAPGTL